MTAFGSPVNPESKWLCERDALIWINMADGDEKVRVVDAPVIG